MPRRLTDQHPLSVRFDALCNFAAEQGIVLNFEQNQTTITDTRTGTAYALCDSDDRTPMPEFPPVMDTMIVTPRLTNI